MGQIQVNLEYPASLDYDYYTMLEKINFDEERKRDIAIGNGFIIGPPTGKLNKDFKDPNGIFSYKYGRTLKDLDPNADRHSCQCGFMKHKINKGLICPICNTPVKFLDDNFEYFGWKVLNDPYFIIHPGLYKSLSAFIGTNKFKNSRLDNMLLYIDQKDKDGYIVENRSLPKEADDEPFYGIGMMAFRERFDEIMDYYSKQANTNIKKSYYEDIMKERDKIFSSSIPVFSFLMRPADINQRNFAHEDTNDDYIMINRIASILNSYDDLITQKQEKSPRDKLLYNLQSHVNNIYSKIDKILQGKKGILRSLLSGRYNFTARNVIAPDPSLRIDQIKLPYKCLVELLQQRIINILKKTYNMNGSDAYNMWYKASIHQDPVIVNIIETIIRNSSPDGKGLPVIINRNPTIAYGGILQMYCVGINFNYSMSVPLQILPLLAADFDGDVINIMLIINLDFFKRANEIFNPANAMYISRNDGKFNNQVNHQKDTIINSNTLLHLGDNIYTDNDIKNIDRILCKWVS